MKLETCRSLCVVILLWLQWNYVHSFVRTVITELKCTERRMWHTGILYEIRPWSLLPHQFIYSIIIVLSYWQYRWIDHNWAKQIRKASSLAQMVQAWLTHSRGGNKRNLRIRWLSSSIPCAWQDSALQQALPHYFITIVSRKTVRRVYCIAQHRKFPKAWFVFTLTPGLFWKPD
jgi:hypothetical protein